MGHHHLLNPDPTAAMSNTVIIVFGLIAAFAGYDAKLVNVAQGKFTEQSSTWMLDEVPLSSDLAVDGNDANSVYDLSCSHTANNNNSWWRIDLGQEYKIKKVVITTRGDCSGDRINGATIDLYGFKHDAPTYCATIEGMETGQTAEFTCEKGRYAGKGRWIKIKQPDNYLQLCEVKVF